jgi:hypothetical protein
MVEFNSDLNSTAIWMRNICLTLDHTLAGVMGNYPSHIFSKSLNVNRIHSSITQEGIFAVHMRYGFAVYLRYRLAVYLRCATFAGRLRIFAVCHGYAIFALHLRCICGEKPCTTYPDPDGVRHTQTLTSTGPGGAERGRVIEATSRASRRPALGVFAGQVSDHLRMVFPTIV